MTVSIKNPDELVAVIPHMLGFKPEESIVFVPMRSDLPTARVDIPTTPRDQAVVWRSIRDGLTRYAQPGAAVGIICFAADRQQAEVVGREFAERLDTIGIDTHVLLWADATRWADLVTGDMGLQTDAARERVAAMTVLGGRLQPAASRDALADSLIGDRVPVSSILHETREAARGNTSRVEGRWALGRLQRFHRDGVRLDDKDAARLLVAVDSIPTRDRLWLDMTRGNAASHVTLWTDLTKRAPDEVRAAPAPASLLAFGSWLSGHGAMAWCALDQVPRDKPYALASLVAAAVQTGCTPASGRQSSPCPQIGALTAPPTSRGLRARNSALFGPHTESEERPMKTTYRRRESESRLEHLLARLLRRYVAPKTVVARVDMAHTEVIEFRRV